MVYGIIKSLCFERTKSSFVTNWNVDLREKSLLRSYRLYKMEFNTECYLDCVNSPKYRIPVSKIRASPHDLEIERGRYTRPKLKTVPLALRLGTRKHFVTSCRVTINERQSLFTKIRTRHLCISIIEKNSYFLSCKDRKIITWLGKCLHKSFIPRNMKTNRSSIPPQHAGTSWWSTESFCVHWLAMLKFCFTVSMIRYRNIQRCMTCT